MGTRLVFSHNKPSSLNHILMTVVSIGRYTAEQTARLDSIIFEVTLFFIPAMPFPPVDANIMLRNAGNRGTKFEEVFGCLCSNMEGFNSSFLLYMKLALSFFLPLLKFFLS